MTRDPSSIIFPWIGPTNLYPGQVQSWDHYFLNMAQMVATKSKCLSRREGAIVVRNNRIIATGYNGASSGVPECRECHRTDSGQDLFKCMALHAEENAILQVGIDATKGSKLYTTLQPCLHCAKMIIQAGIKEVWYIKNYVDDSGIKLLETNGVNVIQS